MTINIDGSGSTDGGLEFGGRIRLRSDEGDAAGATSSANIWMGNDLFRITVGNTDGALVNRVAYFDGSVGLTGLHDADNSFNIGTSQFLLNTYSSRGNAGDVVRLDFNIGGFGVSLSTDSTGDHLSNGSEDAIAASYNFGDWNVAAGYASNVSQTGAAFGGRPIGTEQDLFSISAAGNIGDFGVNVNYSDLETVGTKAVLSGSYTFDATTLTAFVAQTSEDTLGSAGIGATGDETEYGLGFTHNLGGATLAGGISRDYTEETMADLGVRFSF